MKKILIIFSAILLTVSCKDFTEENPYKDTMCFLLVNAGYPEGYEAFAHQGVAVTIEEINTGTKYRSFTNSEGKAIFDVPCGLYRINISDAGEKDFFNGSSDKVVVTEKDVVVNVPLMHSKAGTIVIKEVYCGGCKKLPQEGTYQSDKYVILHNNDLSVRYLDGLCLGTLFPYNSNANNPFVTRDKVTKELVFPDYVPIAQAVWQFGGTGTSFPLQPGEDAVICFNGAIDHTVQYPLSVNLNKPGYFVCYNETYFNNTTYHPTPGDNISPERYLNVVVKTGRANAYTFSINSPALVLFEAKGMTMDEFVNKEGNIMQIPGYSSDKAVTLPVDWVIDALEVFNGTSTSNVKRLQASLDAGYVTLSGTYLCHTLMRKTDEALTASSGFEVLADTNNSSNDFYERETQSLHE